MQHILNTTCTLTVGQEDEEERSSGQAHKLKKTPAGQPLQASDVDEMLADLGAQVEALKESIDLGNMYKREAGKRAASF